MASDRVVGTGAWMACRSASARETLTEPLQFAQPVSRERLPVVD
jgi:hypothetical protein